MDERLCKEELQNKGCSVNSLSITKQDDFKVIVDASIVGERGVTILSCLKVYDTNKFEQIERVYTILNLLSTKLRDEAKKKNETFVNLLPITYKTWKRDDLFFALEEKIEGKTLADAIINNEYQTFPAFVQVTKQICDAVAMLHRPFPPIVHCDIKEGNIIIDRNDHVVKIIDFDAAYIEGSGSYNTVRSTKGYRPTEMVNSAPVSQSDIYAIGCIMENILKLSDWKDKLDSQCNDKLKQIIIKSKEELNRRYYDVNELKAALSEVEILYMLQSQMNKLDDTDCFNVYSYSNDRSGRIDELKQYLIDYSDIDVLYVAVRESQTLAFSKTGLYRMNVNVSSYSRDKNYNIEFITYDELVACIRRDSEDGMNIVTCISRSFVNQWKLVDIELPFEAAGLVCEILNNIVLFKNSYYAKERIADYYSNKCFEANDILSKKELEGKRHELEFWWNLVIYLGSLACEKEDECGYSIYSCNNILAKVYANKGADLRHRFKENIYNERLYKEIIECFEKEEQFGVEDAQIRKTGFIERVEEKKKEVEEKEKQPNMLNEIGKSIINKLKE